MSCVALALHAIVLSICFLLQLTGGIFFLFKAINIRVKMVGYLTFLFQVWKNVIKNNRQVLAFIFNCVHKQQLNWKEASFGASKGKSTHWS